MQRRLYFFPALLPLAELVPWVLTLLGAVASLAGVVSFWRRHRPYILGAGLLLFLAAAGAWQYYRPELEIRLNGTALTKTDRLPGPTPLTPEPKTAQQPGSGFRLLWTMRSDEQILSSPVIADGHLVYGLYKGGIAARRLSDGKPAWHLPTDEPVFALTRAADGEVYAGEGLHYTEVSALMALDASTGAVRWQRRFGGHIEETAAIGPDAVYTGTGPGGLWALARSDAAVLWHAKIGHIDASPLLHDGAVYAPAQPKEGSDNSVFYALDAATGKTRWTIDLPGQPWGSPLLNAKGDIILSTTGRGQIGVPRDTDAGWAQGLTKGGTVLWQTPLSSMPLQPSLYLPDADIVIHALKNGDIVALHAATGKMAWQAQSGGELQAPASLVAGGKLVAAVTYNGVFTLRDAATGRERARWSVGKYATASPIGPGDEVYVTTAWFVYAFTGLDQLP